MRWLPVISPPQHPPGALPGGAALEPVAPLPDGRAPREKRVYVEVFGCQMNKLDAELLLGVLSEEGYELTGRIEDAGVILFNTCAVREQAENRVFSRVGQLRALKRRRPEVVIGILGCSAQNHQGWIFERYPHVGIVCGPGEFLRLGELIPQARRGARVAAVDLERPVRFQRRRNLGPDPCRAYVSVMRGCDMACTFCIVPRTRGPEVSRPVREVVEEVRALVAGGVREVTLLGQTVNSYGKRFGPGRRIGLHHVLHELNKIGGLERIRFVTSHPRFMSRDLIAAMADLEKVCEYLHLPVQSGSDAVLRRMQRSYSLRHYLRVVEACRERLPDLGLATDFIVGFPGETESDFQASRRLMEEVRFQGAFVFRYSPRRGTQAARWPDDVPEEVKRERNQALLELQKKIGLELHSRQIGRVVEVLVEGPSKQDPGRWTGRDRRFQIVVFPQEGESDLAGKLVPVRITEATPLTLVGERAGAPR